MTSAEQASRERIRMVAGALFERGESISRVARDLRVGVRQVEKWRSAWRQGGSDALRSKGPSAVPQLDPAKALIDAMLREDLTALREDLTALREDLTALREDLTALREDLTAPKKQRHTVRRIHARLIDDHQLVEITYSTVRDYVHGRCPRIWVEAGR
jgi:transposase-like protein